MPKEVYVNAVIEKDKRTYGVAVLDHTVSHNLTTIFKNDIRSYLEYQMRLNPKKEFYAIDRFCQYVVYFEFRPPYGMSLRLTDLHNDSSLLEDECKELNEVGWPEDDIQNFRDIFQEIQLGNKELAILTIKDPVPVPDF